MKPFGMSFRIGVGTIGIVGALFVCGSSASAAVIEDGGLRELWEQYPLDPSSGASVRADVADRPAPSARVPGMRPERNVDPDARAGAWPDAFGLAALAVLIAAGTIALLQAFGSAGYLRLPLRERGGAWIMRKSPPTASMFAVLPSRAVLQGLLRAATASAPTTAPAAGTAGSEWSTAKPSIGRTFAPASAELPKSSAGRVDRLKQKQSMDATTRLKDKERARARAKEQLTKAERNLLKEKLAASPRPANAPAKQETAAVAAKSDINHTSVLQADPKRSQARTRRSHSAPRVAAVPSTPTCEVRWWRGYVMSDFLALETNAEGIERVIARSRAFRWRKHYAPPEMPEAAAALSELINRLQHEGWTLAGRGESWFNVRLKSNVRNRPAGLK
jgi:hypothetical protein